MAQGWSSLPADLVNRVADCLLATNDLDCYTDLRAVCHHWRSVTADPGSNQDDPRFRPSRWIMLDEDKASSAITDGPFLFVNTSTGRFLRRKLPLLRHRDGYVFVTSTTDGLLVLVAAEPPRAVSVLNPFTGSLIRFAAPLPTESGPRLLLTADVVGSSPTLVLVSVGCNSVYWAEPQSECFSDMRHRECPASRLPHIAAAVNRDSVSGAKDMFDLLIPSEEDKGCRCYAVVAATGDMLAVVKRRCGVDVFKVDAAGTLMERVKSIGNQALFLGVRCIAVDTDCFPTLEPNCAYFQLVERSMMADRYYHIYKFNIGIGISDEEEPEYISVPMDNMRPLTLTQLLCNYTMDIPGQPLTYWKMSLNNIGADCYDDYIDYEDDYDSNPYFDDFLEYLRVSTR